MSGEIPACPYMGCEFKCCNFDQGNYIVMYPGEHEDAVERGESVAHLRVIDDDDNGGKRAVCEASSCADCDGGYKPLDCASYPLFPDPDPVHRARYESQERPTPGPGWIRGDKCPLPTDTLAPAVPLSEALDSHAAKVGAMWGRVFREKGHRALDWLAGVRLVGYSKVE